MKRWNNKQGKNIENKAIDEFLKDIVEVCEKHKMAISHEDIHGCFEITTIENGDTDWLLKAIDDT